MWQPMKVQLCYGKSQRQVRVLQDSQSNDLATTTLIRQSNLVAMRFNGRKIALNRPAS
jgi:hypothetical protein